MSSDRLNILVAYPYMSKTTIEALVEHQHKINFYLDSGAFTARNAGKEIKLDDYCRFLDTLPVKPERYFALDVIGDAKATMINYKEMVRRGYNPIPVFTAGQDFEDIERYYETSDIIGCGGLANKFASQTFNHLRRVMQIVKGRKIHLLGYTKSEYMKYFKPYSCDSSSWLSSRRYGQARIYQGHGNFSGLNRVQAHKKPPAKILAAINRLGIDISQLSQQKNWVGGNNIAFELTTKSWCQCIRDVEKHLKTRIFLAATTNYDITFALKCWDETA